MELISPSVQVDEQERLMALVIDVKARLVHEQYVHINTPTYIKGAGEH